MNEVSKLFQLQTVDLDLDDKRRQIQYLDTKIGETTSLQGARQQLTSAQDRVKSLGLAIRRLEGELESCAAKIADLQKRLFGGAVGKQKEAGAVEHQLDSMKAARGRIEDELLELMSELEDLPPLVADLTAELERKEGLWSEEQKTLLAERDDLQRLASDLEETRRRLQSAVPERWLKIYEELRNRHRGRAVARVERSTCQGCRVALPMGEIRQARESNDLAFCSFCGRILFLER